MKKGRGQAPSPKAKIILIQHESLVTYPQDADLLTVTL